MEREVEDGSISLNECLALVERVAASQELRRAARLRGFLLYVSEQTLKSGMEGLHEQEIGAAVFGRPDVYDTGIDNIVRVNATELRKRLEHYFAGEGINEPTILEIPRGSYAPVFRRREAVSLPVSAFSGGPVEAISAEAQAVEPEVSPEVSTVAPVRRQAVWAWKVATVVLLLLSLALGWQNRTLARRVEPWKRNPALQRFWGEFFPPGDSSGGETDVVLADTSLALAEDMLGQNVTLRDYLDYNYKRLAEAPGVSADRRQALALVLGRNNGSVGDFRVAQQVMTLDTDPARLSLKFAREYTAEAARHNSLILIGSRKSNPWVDLFADRLNFDFQYDPARNRTFIVNRNPRPGEQPTYLADPVGEPPTSGYGVIACLPSLSGKGRALILEGTDSQATAATGEFITSEDSLAAFERNFPPGPIPYFEVLLRTSQLSGTPIHAEVIAYRIYPR